MAVTENLHTGNGSKTNYSFTFPYLKTTDIKASVDGTVVTTFTAATPTATEIQFNTAPANNAAIRIYRDTQTDKLAATFFAGSAIKSQDLNENFLQNLYVTQEAKNNADAAWQDGDETINSTETWHTSDDTKVATTKAIENRVTDKIKTALTGDVEGGQSITVTDNSPSTGKITVAVTSASIDTTQLAADAVTGAKIEDDAIDSEHYAAGSIDNEHLAVNSVDSDQYVDGSIDSAHIGNDQIDSQHYAAGSIDNEHLAVNSVDSDQYVDGSIDQIHMSANSVDSDQYVDGSIDHEHLANDVIDGDNIQNDVVNSEHIAAGAVDLEHMSINSVDSDQYVDGSIDRVHLSADIIDATKIADNAVTTDHIQDAELTTLAGMQSGTASILAGSTALAATTDELNILDNKSFRASGDGALTTTSDTEIPSSKVVAAHVAAQLGTVGGFSTIATEVAFPATASQPAAGVIVSISDAAGVVVNGSGVSTTGRTTDGTPATVTINSFPSSLNNETLASGVGLLVTSTGSSNTYTYHKILAAETDVKQLSDDINDFNARYRVAGSAPGSNNDAGDMYFDTAANKMKVYNGTTSSWDDVASVGNFYINTISSSSGTGGGSATFNGSAYRFTLSNAPTMAQQLIVSVNGVIQKPNSGTSQPSEGFAISGNDILFSAAPASGSDYFIVTQGSSVSIGTPSDNTVSTAKIQNLAVDNGKIANDTIAEGKLDIHNAPSGTDKFLKYTSNGMEWVVDNNTIYTHPNHSGEVTSTADGAQVITDDVVDEANLKISNAGSNGQYLQKQSGNTGGLTWSTVDLTTLSASNLTSGTVNTARLGSGTANSGSFLAGNNTWQEISAAPEVTGTASGSIAANAGVQVNSDGTLSQPASISEANGSETSTSSSYPVQNQWGQAYDSDTEKVIQYWAQPYNSNSDLENKGHIRIGTVSGTSISWGSHLDFGTGNNAWPQVIFHPPTGKVVATWAQYLPASGGTSSGNVYWRVGTISGTSITWGSPVSTTVSNSDYGYPKLFWNPDDPAKIGLGYKYNNYIRLRHCTVSTTSNTCTDNGQSATIGPSGSSEWDILLAEGQIFAAFQTGGSSYTIKVVGLGTDYSYDSSKLSAPASGMRTGSPRLAYDKANSKLVVLGWRNNSTTIAYIGSVTGSGTDAAFSWSPERVVDSAYSNSIAADYCKKAEKFIFFTGGGGSVSLESVTAVVSGTNFTFDTQVTHRSGAGARPVVAEFTRIDDNGGSSNGKYIFSTCFTTGSGHDDTIRTVVKQLPSTTKDPNKYLGISKASYSNGQTATVKVVGNTADSSSLTPNTTYYIQNDGTIGSTASDVTVGKAFSTTKILIK